MFVLTSLPPAYTPCAAGDEGDNMPAYEEAEHAEEEEEEEE